MNIKDHVTGTELDALREALINYAGYMTDNAYRYRRSEGPSPQVEIMEEKAKAAKALLKKLA